MNPTQFLKKWRCLIRDEISSLSSSAGQKNHWYHKERTAFTPWSTYFEILPFPIPRFSRKCLEPFWLPSTPKNFRVANRWTYGTKCFDCLSTFFPCSTGLSFTSMTILLNVLLVTREILRTLCYYIWVGYSLYHSICGLVYAVFEDDNVGGSCSGCLQHGNSTESVQLGISDWLSKPEACQDCSSLISPFILIQEWINARW